MKSPGSGNIPRLSVKGIPVSGCKNPIYSVEFQTFRQIERGDRQSLAEGAAVAVKIRNPLLPVCFSSVLIKPVRSLPGLRLSIKDHRSCLQSFAVFLPGPQNLRKSFASACEFFLLYRTSVSLEQLH